MKGVSTIWGKTLRHAAAILRLVQHDPSEPEGEQDMAKLLTATGLLLGLMMVGELAYGASADEPRTPVECSTTILGDIVSCN